MRFALLLLLAASASAQDYTREGTRPVERMGEERRKAELQREAELRREAETREVTYEQVMTSPDDIDLNYRWARSQALRGDLKGASATLERILMLRPDLIEARLFRAAVLLRLGVLDESERELNSLRGAAGAEGVQEEVEGYLKEIRRARRRTHLAGRLSGGFQYDTNRNAAPASGRRLFFDVPLALSGDSLEKKDTSLLASAGLDLSHDLGEKGGHRVFASADYFRGEQTAVDFLDIAAYSASAGGLLRTRWADITASGRFDHVLLAQDTYLRSRGGRLAAERLLGDRLRLGAVFNYAYQDYVPTGSIPAADERTGNETTGSLEAAWAYSRSQATTLSLAHTRKDALKAYNAYDRESVSLSHTWLPGRGVFLTAGASGDFDRYCRPDPVVSALTRRDSILTLRGSAGVPLDLAARALRGASLILQYEHYRAYSNITSYQYDNHKLSATLMHRWEL